MPAARDDSSETALRRALSGFGDEVGRQALAGVVQWLEGSGGLTGREIGDYRLGRELGRGGMGVVYEAEQTSVPGRTVAVKLLRGAFGSETARQRFAREVEVVGRLDHPHIVPILSADLHGETPFYAMKRIAGRTLRAVLQAGELRGDVRAIATMIRDLALALQHAHEHGAVHRDVKPGNVLVDEHGLAMLLDFGLASFVEGDSHLTLTSDAVGTPDYMAPEQVTRSHGPITARTDVYGLGVTLYECLSGRPPYAADTRHETMTRIVRGDAVRLRAVDPTIPRDLENICAVAMAAESSRRYASAAEFAADLDAFLEFRPVRARPPGLTRRVAIWLRNHRLLAAVATFSLLAFAAAALWFGAMLPARAIEERLAAIDAGVHRRDEVVRQLAAGERRIAELRRRTPSEVLRQGLGTLGIELRQLGEERTRLEAEIENALESCLALDPDHVGARARYADLLAGQLRRLLDGGGVALRRDSIERWQQRLARVDVGAHEALLDRIGTLRVTCPLGHARLWLCPQVELQDGRSTYAEIDDPSTVDLGSTPATVAAEEGNYALRASLDGHAAITLPWLLRRGAVQSAGERAIALEFLRPEVIGAGYRQIHAGYGVAFDRRRVWAADRDELRWHDGFLIGERELRFADVDGLHIADLPAPVPVQLPEPGSENERGAQVLKHIRWEHILAVLSGRNQLEFETDSGFYASLPTPDEWRRAGSGADGRSYPWGEVHDWRFSQNYWSSVDDTQALILGRSPEQDVSPFGVRDLAGSVREVCLPLQPTRELGTKQFLVRGGSTFTVSAEDLMLSAQQAYLHDAPADDIGIRLVRRRLPVVPTGLSRLQLPSLSDGPFPIAPSPWRLVSISGPFQEPLTEGERGRIVGGDIELSGFGGSYSPVMMLWHPIDLRSDRFEVELGFTYRRHYAVERAFSLRLGTQPGFSIFDRAVVCLLRSGGISIARHDGDYSIRKMAPEPEIEARIPQDTSCRLRFVATAEEYVATVTVDGGDSFTARLARSVPGSKEPPERWRYFGIGLPNYVAMTLTVTDLSVAGR
ncbi:MAG: protein kinase [Planctomycetes bacterium]|nr:protein kinase [Planctomycetota bacterium]